MDDLIRILWDALQGEDVDLELTEAEALEVAQALAAAIVAAGWPRLDRG